MQNKYAKQTRRQVPRKKLEKQNCKQFFGRNYSAEFAYHNSEALFTSFISQMVNYGVSPSIIFPNRL